MTQKEAVELLVAGVNRLRVNNGFFGATDGTIGNINLLQRDLNRALEVWQEHRDPNGLQQLAGLLQAYGNLTPAEYEQIIEAIDGEK